jgi:hypothetical protein
LRELEGVMVLLLGCESAVFPTVKKEMRAAWSTRLRTTRLLIGVLQEIVVQMDASMHKVITKLFPRKEETGARLMAYGFLIVMPAVGMAFGGWERLGYWVAVFGAFIAVAGISIHFARNWKKIFHVRE